MTRWYQVPVTVMMLSLLPVLGWAGPVEDAERALAAGDALAAANLLAPVVRDRSGAAKERAKALVLMGQALERQRTHWNDEAEQRCYRSRGGGAACMKQFAAELNARYGAGAFVHEPDLNILRYTGVHYQEAGAGGEGGDAAAAQYHALEKNLVGKPDDVLPRVQAFLEKYPRGEWNRRGRLLLARLNEDIWWIHRNWWWLLYDWQYSEDELIIRGEKYRKAALQAYQEVLKVKKSDEVGQAARREYELVKANQSDNVLYGILTESMLGQTKGR